MTDVLCNLTFTHTTSWVESPIVKRCVADELCLLVHVSSGWFQRVSLLLEIIHQLFANLCQSIGDLLPIQSNPMNESDHDYLEIGYLPPGVQSSRDSKWSTRGWGCCMVNLWPMSWSPQISNHWATTNFFPIEGKISNISYLVRLSYFVYFLLVGV